MLENTTYKVIPLLVSIATIVAIIGGTFSYFSVTKMQIAEMQKHIIEIKTSIQVLENQSEVRTLAVIVQKMAVSLGCIETTLQQQEKRLSSIERNMK